ncbi:MAG TPA: hypothetical protein VFE23_12150 [Usitatibacter sp.]|jgi:hypothetical protein|nr:hypothetical protein [Usitatibacter sp.]
MKAKAFVVATLLAALPLAASAIGKNEKGCLVGGAVGGVGGHLIGGHGVLGAAAGCGVGALVANDQKKKEGEAKRREDAAKRQAAAARHREKLAEEHRNGQ